MLGGLLACTGSISSSEEAGLFEPAPPDLTEEEQETQVDTEVPVETEELPEQQEEREPELLLQAQVENILAQSCGECHGPEGSGQAGLDIINDLEQLVQAELVVPGDAEGSRLIERLRDGSMPPTGYTPPTADDIEQIARFINGWSGPTPVAAEECNNELISFDDVFAQIQTDLLGEDADDRRFLRYVALTNRYNAGVCDNELDVERFALSKLLNSLSVRSRIERPLAIDAQETLYRIDLRDYGWDEELEVDGEQFADGWEAIVVRTDYAVEFQGDEADFASQAMGTAVPFLYGDAMLEVSSVGSLYYGLLGIPDTEQALLDDLLIDVQEDLDRGLALRAGTTQSGISRQDRVVQRHDVGAGGERAYWQSFDFGEGANDSIFTDPLDFNEGGSEVIFTLNNGLQAYVIFDDQGQVAEESDILFDSSQDDFRVRTAVSCMTCHATGPLQVRDEVRAFAEANPFNFNADELEAIRELYPFEEDLLAVIEADRQVYQGALGRAGVPTVIADPIATTFGRFNRDVSLQDVAGDLGLEVDVLRSNLPRFDPALSRLEAGVAIDRDEFSGVFLQSLCVAQVSSRNRPLDAICDALR